jgi:hypothetical protein
VVDRRIGAAGGDPSFAPAILSDDEHELEVEDHFERSELDSRLWIPHYLPQWSSRVASAARFDVGGGRLRLRIDDDQPPWCPEFNGWLRVSSLQTGVYAGSLGSAIGQHRFSPEVVVREEQTRAALYTPRYGLFEARVRAIADPANMVALWMIGFEEEPERSAEICIFEIFGRDVGRQEVRVGMGLHPFGDPTIIDDFAHQTVPIDARDPHDYAALWTPEGVAFYVDRRLIMVTGQSPTYPMQFMLNVYEFAVGPEPPPPAERYPKIFEVEWFRGYRPRNAPP